MSSRPLVRVLASLSLCLASLGASAASYSGLVVFGDSLSDSGNNYLVQNAGGFYQAPSISSDVEFSTHPSLAGTYSNGPVWTQYLAQSLGLPLTPSVAGGNNYAFGGAQTATDPLGLPPSLRTQVNIYLGTPGTVVDPNALYIVAGGGNDIRVAVETHADAATLGAMVTQYGIDMAGMVNDLRLSGAQHVLVLNVPNFGLTPMAHELNAVADATLLSAAMNQSLAAHLGGSAQIFDTFSFMTGVVQAGANSGFTNLTNACLVTDHCGAQDGYLFWDGIHPTTQAHQMLASAVLATVAAVPEAGTASMLALGLVVVALSGARRRARQQQG